jgi:insertion element IS1 protein InsB
VQLSLHRGKKVGRQIRRNPPYGSGNVSGELGFGSIGRLLCISYGTVYQWGGKWGKQVELTVSEGVVDIMEPDEMHSYLQKKNFRQIWIAVDRLSKRFIAFVCGDRSTATGIKLWEKIKHLTARIFYAGYWKNYNEFVPRKKPEQTKKETCTVEGYNSRIRHYSVRFKRKTRCYGKSLQMMEISLGLLFLNLNNESHILN